jgi:hypothetical protein
VLVVGAAAATRPAVSGVTASVTFVKAGVPVIDAGTVVPTTPRVTVSALETVLIAVIFMISVPTLTKSLAAKPECAATIIITVEAV